VSIKSKEIVFPLKSEQANVKNATKNNGRAE
jgi:hypothetical protein